jgi:hypothetical protein
MTFLSLIGRFLAPLAFYAILCGIAYLSSTRAHAQTNDRPGAHQGMNQ